LWWLLSALARGYGLLAANAFGARDFGGDKTLDGSMLVAAGEFAPR
jgi:hypothetical protein